MNRWGRRLMGAVAVGAFALTAWPARAQIAWKEEAGTHFIAYHETNAVFAERVLRTAEAYYVTISRKLGFPRYENFWLWENRCRLYIYENRSRYLHFTRQPLWSDGFADYDKRYIASHEEAQEFENVLLPHELTHLLFRDFIGKNNYRIPRWIEEGVAVSQEEPKLDQFEALVKHAIAQGRYIPVSLLSHVQLVGQSDPAAIQLFYAEAQSVVRFLMEGAGDRFLRFCVDLRDGKSMEEALRRNYRQSFSSLDDLERKWLATYGAAPRDVP